MVVNSALIALNISEEYNRRLKGNEFFPESYWPDKKGYFVEKVYFDKEKEDLFKIVLDVTDGINIHIFYPILQRLFAAFCDLDDIFVGGRWR